MGLKEQIDKLKNDLKKTQHKLNERNKVLKFLSEFSQLCEDPDLSISDMLSQITFLIPMIFQYPNLSVLRISYKDNSFKSKNFKDTIWKLSKTVNVSDNPLSIEVYYLEERDFLEKEKKLIKDVANRLKIAIEHKLLYQEIKRLNKFYKKILNSVKSGVWVANKDDIIIYSNNSMEKIANIPKDEIVGRNIYKDFPKSIIKEFIQYYDRAKDKIQPVFYDDAFILTPGQRKSFQSGWLIPIKKKDVFNRMICIVNDITEIKNIKEKLKDRESRYSAIVSSNSIGVAMVDMNGRPIETNDYLRNFLGYNREELKEMPFKEFTYPDDIDIDLKLFEELMQGKREFYHIEKRYIHKKGNIIWGDLTATLVRDSKGIPKYAVSLVQDITEKKRALLELQKSQKKLRELNETLEEKVQKRTEELEKSKKKYKDAFQRESFYKNLITHDMNNILQNIKSSVQLSSMYFEDPSKKEELKELNNILKEQTHRATRLINNASKLSKIDEEEIELKKIDLCERLNVTVELIEKSYQSKNIVFNINCNYENLYLKANELLRDLFENLIVNSIKHNDSSPIEININVTTEKIGDSEKIRMEFIDNGIGIPDKKKDLLFHPHQKQQPSKKGMGLGLSLVKKIVDIYRGKIWVENRIEDDFSKGSKFILLLPKAH